MTCLHCGPEEPEPAVPKHAIRPMPKQARAKETYERILAASQELLAESGIEGFNSNAIVERAGMTPPALYRWFPNKHAILEELGTRLMDAQNDVASEYLESFGRDGMPLPDTVRAILDDTLDVTLDFVGGHAMMVCLRAMPALGHIRLESHDAVAAALSDRIQRLGLEQGSEQLTARCRLVVELGYAAIEMLLETGLERRRLVLDSAAMACVAALDIT